MKEQLKLSELNGKVKRALNDTFTAPVWVMGEISELKVNRSGHCYLTLVEKGEQGDEIVAQARATIWSYTFRMLQPFFETTTGQPLAEGIKILVSVSVEFHELYGYSLNIRDIDPTYTLGDLARRRMEIIAQLKSDGVAEMNKGLQLPLVPQVIAVISSPTAAGYEDFMDQLKQNPGGYHFSVKLFPAIMQGNQAESSIIEALERIYPYEHLFDAVVIIRGGGSQVDLSCFDQYNLAYYITQFPLPVITGIGHEKDDTIVDLVAHTRLKTPTAVAEFLIAGVTRFDQYLEEQWGAIQTIVSDYLEDSKTELERYTRQWIPMIREKLTHNKVHLSQTILKLEHASRQFLQTASHHLALDEREWRSEFKSYLQDQRKILEKSSKGISYASQRLFQTSHDQLNKRIRLMERSSLHYLAQEHHRLHMAAQTARLIDPIKVLARGYSITTYKGKALTKPPKSDQEAIIETRLYEGTITSKIITTQNNKPHESE